MGMMAGATMADRVWVSDDIVELLYQPWTLQLMRKIKLLICLSHCLFKSNYLKLITDRTDQGLKQLYSFVFCIIYGCFFTARAECSSCDQDHFTRKAKNISVFPFAEKVC